MDLSGVITDMACRGELMLPVEVSLVQPDERQVRVTLYLDPGLGWFAGHFPGLPLLPGVAQLDWAMRYARRLLLREERLSAGYGQLQSIAQVKFQSPLLPGDQVLLSLSWQPVGMLLLFSYQREGQVCSSGKLRLC